MPTVKCVLPAGSASRSNTARTMPGVNSLEPSPYPPYPRPPQAGRELRGAEPMAAAVDARTVGSVRLALGQRSDDVQVDRLAPPARAPCAGQPGAGAPPGP